MDTEKTYPRNSRTDAGRAFVAALMSSTVIAGAWAMPAHAQDEGDSALLPQLVIQGASYETEDTDSYTTDLVSVGEKDVRSVREIPQSTAVITSERLEDAGYTSLDTAMRDAPGVVVLNNDNGRSSIFARGFEFDRLYFNGLPAPLSSVYGTQPDMAIVDHVELLYGPAGLFTATGEPAGAVNMRLKQAKDTFEARLTGEYGSWNHRRTELDVTGPITADGGVRGRIVGVWQDEDGWVDNVENGVGVAYGTIQADLTANTTATVSISHMERDITPFNGLPTYSDGTLIDLDRSTYTGADWNNFDNSVTDYIGELEHKFDDGGHAKISARYSQRDVDFLYAWAGSAAAANGDVTQMTYLARDYEETSLALDAHVSKPFEMMGWQNNIILGADYQDVDSTMYQARGTIAQANNIYDWDSDIAYPSFSYGAPTDQSLQQFGVYGQLRVKPIEPLTLIGGARVSWVDQTSTGSNDVDEDAHFTPYAGAVYDLTNWLSAYASYTEIFLPQPEVDSTGQLIGVQTGRQYEAGLKAEFFDGGLNASVAYFNLEVSDRAEAIRGETYSNSADALVQGVDAQASGEITPNLSFMAGYTYTKTEYLNTDAEGEPFNTYTPEHMFHLFGKYTFSEGHALDGFYVGGGLNAFSEFSSGSIEAPGYMTVDVVAGYEFNDHFEASLVVNNVLDEKYYARVGSSSVFNFYGEPLSAKLKLTAKY